MISSDLKVSHNLLKQHAPRMGRSEPRNRAWNRLLGPGRTDQPCFEGLRAVLPLLFLGVFLTLSLGGCASLSSMLGGGHDNESVASVEDEADVSDPLEEVNRAVFAVNEGLDKVILEPVAKGYRKVTPRGVRVAAGNFLRNLKSPLYIGNEVLQGDFKGAANATARALINTLAGFGGLVDVAAEGGIEFQEEDFGQTLAKWGFGEGPYIVLPLLGPGNLRDDIGLAVDAYADPLRLYLFNTDREGWHYARLGAGAISKREELIDVIDDLRKTSFDYYAAVRSAYHQRREALIRDEDPEQVSGPDIPDYDE